MICYICNQEAFDEYEFEGEVYPLCALCRSRLKCDMDGNMEKSRGMSGFDYRKKYNTVKMKMIRAIA